MIVSADSNDEAIKSVMDLIIKCYDNDVDISKIFDENLCFEFIAKEI